MGLDCLIGQVSAENLLTSSNFHDTEFFVPLIGFGYMSYRSQTLNSSNEICDKI